MARVYAVVDERTGDRLALKRLTLPARGVETQRAMFENEYQTLLQLQHPAIVRVRDFGAQDGDVFYTMELLEGGDLHGLAQGKALGVPEACLLLRDVASALALLHSRNLVHRDIGPRNVWCTPERRAKVIDFGALVAMSRQRRVVGTPPYVPPEAVHGEPLDGRTDLYALGALGYYLLMGQDAYPAKSLAQLPAMWGRPVERLDRQRPEVPGALAELIAGLLNPEPRGRPPSAAEVVDRLNAITELPAEDARPLAESYLTTPSLVGRDGLRAHVRRVLEQAQTGRGSAVCLVGDAGLGRSRMLTNLLVEAKLLGARTVAVEADALGVTPRAVAGELSSALAEVSQAAAHLSGAAGRGGHDRHRPPLDESTPAPPQTQTVRIGLDLVAAIELESRGHLTAIAIDDVHRADESSLAVLMRLASAAPNSGFVLAITCDRRALQDDDSPLSQLVAGCDQLELQPLAPTETRALLGSMLGEPEGIDDAAAWLHDLSQGSPEACLHYLRYLVERGLARYDDGRWTLEPRLRDHALPESFEAMLTVRLRALSEDALQLALGLALTFDDTRPHSQPETYIFLRDYPKLLGGDSARAFAAVAELLRARVLEQREDRLVLAQRALADLLRREAGQRACAHMHLRLANIFQEGEYRDVILTYRQLQRAGEHRRAMQLLAEHAGSSESTTRYDWEQLRIAMAVESFRAAVEYFHAEGGTPREGILLRRSLLAATSVYAWDVGRHGDDQVARLRQDSGLDQWDETDPSLPATARISHCLTHAQQRHGDTLDHERGFSPLEAIRELASNAMLLGGVYTNAHDIQRLDQLQPINEMLRPLSPVTEVLADVGEMAQRRARGLELAPDTAATIDRLLQCDTLPDIMRSGAAFVLNHVHGVELARRGQVAALERADQLALSTTEDRWAISHLRWLGLAFRGEDARAEALRGKVEGAAEDDVWRRKAFLFVEAQLHALTGDLIALKQATRGMQRLANQFPGWQPWADFGRGETHRLRGELAQAESVLAGALLDSAPGRHRAYIAVAPAHAEVLRLRGSPDAALEAARAIVENVKDYRLDRSAAISALRVQALAHAQLDDLEAAEATLEQAMAHARAIDLQGLPMTPLFEAAGSLALRRRDAAAFASALASMEARLERAQAPMLHRRCHALRQAGDGLLRSALASVERPSPGCVHDDARVAEVVAIDDDDAFARAALSVIVRGSGASGGHLMMVDGGAARVIATTEATPPDAELVVAVGRWSDELERRTATTAEGSVARTRSDAHIAQTVAHSDVHTFLALPAAPEGSHTGGGAVAVLLRAGGTLAGGTDTALLAGLGEALWSRLADDDAITRVS